MAIATSVRVSRHMRYWKCRSITARSSTTVSMASQKPPDSTPNTIHLQPGQDSAEVG